jgi:DNA-binding NarL/FixJ family response regulator
MKTIRVLLVDDHRFVLDSLRLLLPTLPGVEVVGACADPREVMPFLANATVDIVLTDLTMPHLTGLDLAGQIRVQFPTVRVLLLTVADDGPTIREALQQGVAGYISKKAGKDEIERAIHAVMAGQPYLAEDSLAELLKPIDTPDASLIALTRREHEVIRLLAAELSSADIAEKLFISIGTVDTHRHNILRKLGVKSTIGIVKYALKHNLV